MTRHEYVSDNSIIIDIGYVSNSNSNSDSDYEYVSDRTIIIDTGYEYTPKSSGSVTIPNSSDSIITPTPIKLKQQPTLHRCEKIYIYYYLFTIIVSLMALIVTFVGIGMNNELLIMIGSYVIGGCIFAICVGIFITIGSRYYKNTA